MNDEEVDKVLRFMPRRALDGHPDDAVWLALQSGGADEATRASLEAHLADCASCRSLWADMAAPVTEAEVQRARSAPSTPAPRRWRPWLGAALAAGFALGVGLTLPEASAPTGPPGESGVSMPDWQWYRPGRPQGGVAEMRGAEAPRSADTPARYLGYSEVQIRIDIDPAAPASPTPTFAAFVSEGESGALRAAPRESLRALEGGGLLLRAQAEALLGSLPGARRVYIALGAGSPLLAGVSAGQVQAEAAARGLKVFEFPIVLIAEAPGDGAQ